MSALTSCRVSRDPGELGEWGEKVQVCLNGRQIWLPLNWLRHLTICTEYRNIIQLRVDEAIFEEFYVWLTTGNMIDEDEVLEPFTYTAYKNNIQSLLDVCEQRYLEKLTKASCIKLWLIGGDYDFQRLESEALQLVRDNFEEISCSDEWCNIDKHRVKRILEDKDLYSSSPPTVHQALHRWSSYDSGVRTEAGSELLECLCSFNDLYLSNQTPYLTPCHNQTPHLTPCHNQTPDLTPCHNQIPDLTPCHNQIPDLTPCHNQTPDLNACHNQIPDLNACHNQIPDLNPCPEHFTEIFVGQRQTEQSPCLLKAILQDGLLTLKMAKSPVPREIDSESAFVYSSELRCLFASTEKHLWSFSLGERKSWKKLKPNSSIKRSKHIVSAVGNEIFVLGGYDLRNLRPTPYIHAYSWTRGNWLSAKMELAHNLVFGHSVSIGSSIYMFGNTVKKEGEVIQKKMLQVFDTKHSYLRRAPSFPRDNATVEKVVASRDGLIYVMSNHGDVLQYNPSRDDYKTLCPLPAQRVSFGASVQDRTLFVFGGIETRLMNDNRQVPSYCLNLHQSDAMWKQCGSVSLPVRILS